MDLIEKLKAAIAVDEQIARRAAWSVSDHTYAPVDVDDQKTEMTSHWVTRGVFGIHKRVMVDDPGWEPKVTDTVWLEVGDHIALHDPARVLREVAAKRKILELHVRVILRAGGGADYYKTTNVCRSCEPRRGALVGEHSWPCPTLLALAEGYGITGEEA
jgi:hypothetical protein